MGQQTRRPQRRGELHVHIDKVGCGADVFRHMLSIMICCMVDYFRVLTTCSFQAQRLPPRDKVWTFYFYMDSSYTYCERLSLRWRHYEFDRRASHDGTILLASARPASAASTAPPVALPVGAADGRRLFEADVFEVAVTGRLARWLSTDEQAISTLLMLEVDTQSARVS
eukprot:SAG31_NODE_2082_length_6484_cov_11.246245_3_plen_169_part_00